MTIEKYVQGKTVSGEAKAHLVGMSPHQRLMLKVDACMSWQDFKQFYEEVSDLIIMSGEGEK